MEGSVEFMASTPRPELSAELAQAVVTTAAALLSSEVLSPMRAEDISVVATWARRDNVSFSGHMKRASTLDLVKALRLCAWPTTRPPILYSVQPEENAGETAPNQKAVREQSRPRGLQSRRW